jgi:DNA-binding helix-hairpin-helix protein with protein kinase domain
MLQFLRVAVIALFSRPLPEKFSFTTAQHADMWVAALQTAQQSVLKRVSSAMHALCCHQQA